MECAKLILQAGIIRVVYCNNYHKTDGLELLTRAGIEIVFIDLEKGVYEIQ
jgi:dCMP deaminase